MAGESRIVMLSVTDEGGYVYHPVVIWDDDDVILIDTGSPGMMDQIRARMEEAGAPFARLNRVILTHQDLDHIGGLAELVGVGGPAPGAEVMAHELAVPYIRGEEPLLKYGTKAPAARVDRTIADGETLPVCGGLTVIHTPGHTPDHLSVYHIPSKTLIAGDATGASEGRITGPNPVYTPDLETARQSLRKLASFDIETVICYHGGRASGEAFREYVASL